MNTLRPIRSLAAAASLAAIVLFTACAEATQPAPRAAQLEIASGASQALLSGHPVEPLVVRALDANGAPLPGVEITWTRSNGRLSETSSITGEDGTATVTWQLFGAREYTATAYAFDVAPVHFERSILIGPEVYGWSFTPTSTSLAEGPVTVDVSALVRTDYIGIGRVSVAFFNRDRPGTSVHAILTRTGGDEFNGTYTGSVVITEEMGSGPWAPQVFFATKSLICDCDGTPYGLETSGSLVRFGLPELLIVTDE